MKIADLLTAQPVLQNLMMRKMSAKLAYAIAKNYRLIAYELEDYEKARVKLLSENWKLNEEDNKFNVPEEDLSKWKSMHEELLQTESCYKPYLVDIALADQVESWTPAELISLWFIFEGNGSSDLAPKANS